MEFNSFLGHAGLRFLLSSAFIVPGSCRLTFLVHLKITRLRSFVLVHKYCHQYFIFIDLLYFSIGIVL
jgi:hypothetical protein